MKRSTLSLALLTTAASLLLSLPALADSLTFNLTNSSQTGAPGTTLSYNATVIAAAANTGNVYLNGDSFNFSGAFLPDDSPFFNNFPVFLTPGQSASGVFFTLSLPATATGIYTGAFTLLGGSTDSSSNALGSASFQATVPSTVPEPATWLLLFTGAAGSFRILKLRHNA